MRETLRALYDAVKAHEARTGEGVSVLAERLKMTPSNLSNMLARLRDRKPVAWDTAERIAGAVGYKLVLMPETAEKRKKR